MRHKGWQGPLPVIAAVVIVATLSLLTVTVLSSFTPDDDDVALLDTGETTTTTSTTLRTTTTTTRPTTTTIAPRPDTTEAPEVLGDVTVRNDDVTTTTAAPSPSPSPSPSPAPAPAPASPSPTTSPPPPETTTTSTTTTTIECRNSNDPACGPLEWDPEPPPYEVEVYAVATPTRATVGDSVVFAVNRVEPAGADALGACTSWQVSDPGVVSTSSCEAVNHSCDRYGPHDPPAPSREELTLSRTIRFTTAGEHEVTVSGHTATHLADGCASPYLESWTRTFTILVTED